MKIILHRAFKKSLSRVPSNIEKKTAIWVSSLEDTTNKEDAIRHHDIGKIQGYDNYYRIRIGKYRIGFEIINDTIILHFIGMRGDFYKNFPPK